jgi:hypothetical protein
VQSLFQHDSGAVVVACIVLIAALALWCILLQRRMRALEVRLDDIFQGASSENMARMLADYLGMVRGTAATVNQLQAKYSEVSAVLPSTIRHVGLIRFSPFHDTGGDQSFALALLDGRGTGVVMTGLHSRSESRLYAKPIERGRSTYVLTPEEQQAMDRALGRETSRVG